VDAAIGVQFHAGDDLRPQRHALGHTGQGRRGRPQTRHPFRLVPKTEGQKHAAVGTEAEALMRFYSQQHRFYCGVDLHARTLSLCILDAQGTIVRQQTITAGPDTFLRAVAPFRDGLAVACECMFAWYWLADLCQQENIPFVLGHAL
jgi:hypothetical protein